MPSHPSSQPPHRRRYGLRLALLAAAFSLLGWLSHGCLTSPADLQCRPCIDNGSCILEAFQCLEGICRPRANPNEFTSCETPPTDQ